MITTKSIILTILGGLGGFILSLFGGWSNGMTALAIFMAADIITGVLVAVFQKSQKTVSGGLSSKTMSTGLCRKGMIILLILVAAQLDMLLGITYVRDAVIIAFCANELLSIVENAGLMGLKIPAVIGNAIDILNKKGDVHDADT